MSHCVFGKLVPAPSDIAVQRITAPRIAQDLQRFLDGIESDRTIDPKSLGINSSVAESAERIAQAYGLDRRRST